MSDPSASAPSDGDAEYRQYKFTAPPGATELLLVRHGESAPARMDEPFQMLDGQGDPDLAPEGRAEAERVGERLALERIDAVYVSTLRRTRQTAEPLCRRLGIDPTVDPDFREVHLGEWEGGLFRKLTSELHPTAVRMWSEERWDVIPGAEGTEAFAARVEAAVGRVAKAHPDQRVAVFTHGGVIGAILARAAQARRFAFIGADNGSISQVIVTADRWIVRRFNDTAHLEQTFTLVSEPLT